MQEPTVPPSPSRRNLDHAFPPFALGLPSVYERAGFDVNRSRSRASSRAGSTRKGSFSSSANGSSVSLRSQGSLGAALPPLRTGDSDGYPHSPATSYSQSEPDLQKPLAPLTKMRRPSSPLVHETSLKKNAPPAPVSAAVPAADPSVSVDTSAAAALAAPTAAVPPSHVADAPPPVPAHSAPLGASQRVPAPAPASAPYNPYAPAPQPADGYAPADPYAKLGTSSPDTQTHSQSASDASTATSDFEFLDPKPMINNTMPLNVKPAWAQAQDRAATAAPPPQGLGAPQRAEPAAHARSIYAPQEYAEPPQPYRPQPTRQPARQLGVPGLLGVPQPHHELNRMSTTSSIYSNRASAVPGPTAAAVPDISFGDTSVGQSSLGDESESSVSFDFADVHPPSSEIYAESARQSQESRESHASSSSTSKKRRYCRGCLNPIVGKSVRSRDGTLSGRWHRDCFMCTRCEAPLTGSTSDIHVHEDQPFCPGCYHVVAHTTCRMCGKGIEGSCLEATADAGSTNPVLYHVNCLRCAECQMHLQQSYFEVDGATYCAEHAFTSLPQDTEVHKRFTQFMMI